MLNLFHPEQTYIIYDQGDQWWWILCGIVFNGLYVYSWGSEGE